MTDRQQAEADRLMREGIASSAVIEDGTVKIKNQISGTWEPWRGQATQDTGGKLFQRRQERVSRTTQNNRRHDNANRSDKRIAARVAAETRSPDRAIGELVSRRKAMDERERYQKLTSIRDEVSALAARSTAAQIESEIRAERIRFCSLRDAFERDASASRLTILYGHLMEKGGPQ